MNKNFALSLVLVLLVTVNLLGATCTTTGASTNYNNTAAWSCGHVPTASDNIVIAHAVTSASAITYQWGTQTVTINSGGYLKITGDLLMQGGNEKIIINSGGTLEVTGTLTTQNGGVTVNVNNGGTLKATTLQVNYGSTVTVASGGIVNVTTLATGNDASALFNNAGTTTVTGNLLSDGGPITNTGTLNVNGNLTVGSSGTARLTNSGNVNVKGNVTANNLIQLNPGAGVDSNMIVDGDFTVIANQFLIIGTNGAATPYANLVIKKDLKSTGSGDLTINKNGRLAVFGSVTDSGGGDSRFIINNGGQVYVDKNINYTGNGSPVTNNNSTSPYGLYVNGTTNVNAGSGMTVPLNLGNKQVMHDTNLPFYNWVSGLPNSPLPVTLVFIKAQSFNSYINLTWATSSEKNFRYFLVERASENLQFTTIGQLDAKGGVVLTDYAFLDERPLNGKNYYRLKIVDADDTFEYSPVVTAFGKSTSGISVYPNPIVDHAVTVEINDSMDTPAQLSLLDGTGMLVLRAKLESNINAFTIPQDVHPGVYFLRVSSGNEQQIIKVVVQ